MPPLTVDPRVAPLQKKIEGEDPDGVLASHRQTDAFRLLVDLFHFFPWRGLRMASQRKVSRKRYFFEAA